MKLLVISVFPFALIFMSACSDDDRENEKLKVVKDVDGNVYHPIEIGSQIWMLENLKVTHYNDGTSIPNQTGGWRVLTTEAYCDYNNDPEISKTYGRLYNYYAVSSGKLCPNGWHVPSNDEWTILLEMFEDKFDAAKKIKESGTSHWLGNLADGTNESGFTALPGGWKEEQWEDLGYGAWWWSSTEYNSDEVYCIQVYTAFNSNPWYKNYGFCVRCIKD